MSGTAPPAAASGLRWLPLTALVIALDQASKLWMIHHFFILERVRLLPVLDLVLTYNPGAAFSMLADASGWQRWVFIALALAVSVVLLVWMRRLAAATQGLIACGLALIVAGALGNLIDRVRLGHVIDFIWAHWGEHYFPAFNVADSAITIGAGLLLLDAWREARAAKGSKA